MLGGHYGTGSDSDVIDVVTPPFHITRRGSNTGPPVTVAVYVYFRDETLPSAECTRIELPVR